TFRPSWLNAGYKSPIYPMGGEVTLLFWPSTTEIRTRRIGSSGRVLLAVTKSCPSGDQSSRVVSAAASLVWNTSAIFRLVPPAARATKIVLPLEEESE